MKQKHFINIKGLTAFVMLALMAFYGAWNNPTAWIYLALHGSYGILWVLKSCVFPDKTWEQRCGLPYGLLISGTLSLYWTPAWLITSRHLQAPLWYLCLCVSMYIVGIVFHFCSDMQKYMFLKYQPGRLLTEGLWKRLRNPNYFGELLIYLGFDLLAMHWTPLLLLLFFFLVAWLPNMRKKDRSLSRYPDFEEYLKRSYLFIPYVY